ncbi:hypothetical protein AGLY_000365 [Aphis glycines]|uniref:Uncharacterized protein n=1 Tax=Aphis glycines TaxID=307491 RepID=A0A6G0U7A1_APHGL|nr:hypothetical protein AGLY_000365 [Aphis glycines]
MNLEHKKIEPVNWNIPSFYDTCSLNYNICNYYYAQEAKTHRGLNRKVYFNNNQRLAGTADFMNMKFSQYFHSMMRKTPKKGFFYMQSLQGLKVYFKDSTYRCVVQRFIYLRYAFSFILVWVIILKSKVDNGLPNKYKGENKEEFYNSRTLWILNFEKKKFERIIALDYKFEISNVKTYSFANELNHHKIFRVFKFYETLKIPKSQGMWIINTGIFKQNGHKFSVYMCVPTLTYEFYINIHNFRYLKII